MLSQCSDLGPLLFILYTSDISSINIPLIEIVEGPCYRETCKVPLERSREN